MAIGFGGDTLNTAIHLARFGRQVHFASALGDDAFSKRLRTDWKAEGLRTDLVLTDRTRMPGLYAITLDQSGERSFDYWRDDSAARRMFALPESASITAAAADTDMLVFSLITLAILPAEGRIALLDMSNRVRARGGKVVFDGNYRPRLWPDKSAAIAARDAAIAVCDIGLPTFEDEAELSGASGEIAVAAHWRALGAEEVVVKVGSRGCLVENEIVPPRVFLSPVDTSGAGDAFNAAYLHARASGLDPRHAAHAGHDLAGWVVTRSGALPAVDGAAPYSR